MGTWEVRFTPKKVQIGQINNVFSVIYTVYLAFKVSSESILVLTGFFINVLK